MRIEGSKFNPLTNQVAQKPLHVNNEVVNTPEEKQDVYRFNSNSQELNKLFELVKTSEVVRYDKIDAIREKIEKGEYSVSGKSVVLKIMEERMNGTKNN